MDIDRVLNLPEFAPVKARAERFLDLLDAHIDFWHKASVKHTAEHVRRVLLFALLIGHAHDLSPEDLDLLATAAIYHDSRRQNDLRDVGHGQRAADYYRDSHADLGLPYSSSCYDVIYWHDRDDRDGIRHIENNPHSQNNAVLLYRIFKDADALDRFRLGPGGLDVRYLRTAAARDLVPFAKKIWENYA